ncbi:MAG: RDD family protein [Wolbachia endosymbiont of Tyrophagus putrescentiae]|nr:RDD family protein [Wolbachia endosymbiont of Tyrophagus putrescentiae]
MDIKVNYAEISRRIVAYTADQIIFLVFFLFTLFLLSGKSLTDVLNYVFHDDITSSIQYEMLGALVYVILEVLMITKLGWTPGKLLCGMYIKDANTFENVALTQIVIRSILKMLLMLPIYISDWFFILPILVLMLAKFDQRKQLFHDKIAKTVVIDYKPEKHHSNLSYVGIFKRVAAYIIDYLTITGITLVFLYFAEMTFDTNKAELLATYLFFLLSIIFGVFMIKRFSGTPGQLLCGIHIKDANTLENITLVQAIVRYVLFGASNILVLNYALTLEELYNKHAFEWWPEPLLILTFVVITLIFISAIFDKHKQFFYDKIARTIAINYKSSS